MPLISIITVVYNGASHLEQCIRSVVEQSYQNVEYIVIDGGSSDGTLEIIRKYEQQIGYWLSEPDNGIYDAMNKGLDKATGEWIYFLGSDDMLSSSRTVAMVVAEMTGDIGLVAGKVVYCTGREFNSGLGIKTLLHNTVHHQAAFYHVRHFSNWRYDTRYRIVADYELNLRLYLSHEPFMVMNEIIAHCSDNGISRTQLGLAFRETNAIRKRFVSPFPNLILSLLYRMEFSTYRLLLFVQRGSDDCRCQGKKNV